MSGAERAERKRKQQAAQVAKTAPAAPPRADQGASRGAVPGIAVAVLLALVVGGGLWLQQRGGFGDLPATIPVAAAGPASPVDVQGDAVVIGRTGAPVTIDVYEDFLCSGCGQFEQLYGDQLEEAAASGQAQIVYHPVAILDHHSEPAGYSTLTAGAAFCAADAGIFPRFHDSLFATQPRGGGPVWSSAQLEQLGRDLGAGDGFARCLQAGDAQRVADATDDARERLSKLRPEDRFGTPTILVNGEVTDPGDQGWLDEVLEAAR